MREQLSTQLLLGIVSRRIPPGERLPSVRELARRLKIHANTVSAAYRDLAARGWVTQRKGSGVYVRDVGLPMQELGIQGFVRAWIEAGAAHGFSAADLQVALQQMAGQPQARELLVIDPDPALARILAAEISEALGYPVHSADFKETANSLSAQTCLLVLPAHAEQAVEQFHPAAHLTIVVRSMEDLLVGHQRPNSAALIGLVSRSDSIRRWSSTLLSALGFAPDSVLLRSPDEPQWKRGLTACHLVAADMEAFPELPPNVKGSRMRIVAPSFLEELRTFSVAK